MPIFFLVSSDVGLWEAEVWLGFFRYSNEPSYSPWEIALVGDPHGDTDVINTFSFYTRKSFIHSLLEIVSLSILSLVLCLKKSDVLLML